MQPLGANRLLDIWDHGFRQPPVWRALSLLCAALDEPLSNVAALSIGQRDGLLLTLREWTFGPELACVMSCPACGERLELTLTTTALRATPGSAESEQFTLVHNDYTVLYRLPTTADLLALADDDAATAQRTLLGRCVLAAHHLGVPLVIELLPDDVAAQIAADMAEHDPQANLELALCCPDCAHTWQSLFDIGAFFWRELDVWAARTLHEVHVLATAYGWHEAEILALTPQRRQHYLQLVNG